MPNDQTAFFDAREHEQPPAHRLSFLPRFGRDVRATCSCGRSFTAASSDLMELAYKRHHAGACSR